MIILEYIYIRILSIYFEFFHALYLLDYALWSFMFDNKVAMTVLVELPFDVVIKAQRVCEIKRTHIEYRSKWF